MAMTKEEKVKVLQRLRPGQVFGVKEDLTVVELDDVPSQAELDAELVVMQSEELTVAIKQAAAILIIQNLPEWKQRNLIAEAAYLLRKDTLTAEEEGQMDDMESAWLWVKAVRSASDLAEAAETPVEDIVWPALPPYLQ